MASSDYHRKQAEVLAGMALSAGDKGIAERFKLRAMEHLAQAQRLEALSSALASAALDLDSDAEKAGD
jgi:hypothetical protein